MEAFSKTYTERLGKTEEGLSSISESGTEDVPINNIGKSDGSSSKRVNRTALSCSCACKYQMMYSDNTNITEETINSSKLSGKI